MNNSGKIFLWSLIVVLATPLIYYAYDFSNYYKEFKENSHLYHTYLKKHVKVIEKEDARWPDIYIYGVESVSTKERVIEVTNKENGEIVKQYQRLPDLHVDLTLNEDLLKDKTKNFVICSRGAKVKFTLNNVVCGIKDKAYTIDSIMIHEKNSKTPLFLKEEILFQNTLFSL